MKKDTDLDDWSRIYSDMGFKEDMSSLKNNIKGCFNKVVGKDVSMQLLVATLHGSSMGVSAFLSAKKVNVDVRGEHGRTPLTIAIINGHPDLVMNLLNHDADPNTKDVFGNTPLMWAARCGVSYCASIIPALIAKGARPDERNHSGKSALDIAIEDKMPENERMIREAMQQQPVKSSAQRKTVAPQ